MTREGIDILVETARMWADLGFWLRTAVDGDGQFHIHGVTGPDEYTTVVNNNLFTNVMARRTCGPPRSGRGSRPRRRRSTYQRWSDRLDCPGRGRTSGPGRRGHAHPYDARLGVHPQDQHFLSGSRGTWSHAVDKHPLLLHYHPLVIYRFQVLKQADVVPALFLQGDEFTAEEKRADFEYYDPITTGDSTLSAVVQSIIAGRGRLPPTWRCATSSRPSSSTSPTCTATPPTGCTSRRPAGCGARWSAASAGCATTAATFTFDPRLPAEWEALLAGSGCAAPG